MIEGPQVFVDIDTQARFPGSEGALFVPGSRASCQSRPAYPIRSRPGNPYSGHRLRHTPDDPELKIFPPHCMIGTAGQERVAATYRAGSVLFDDQVQVPAQIPPHLTLLKRQHDLFTHPQADAIVALYATGRPASWSMAWPPITAWPRPWWPSSRHCRIALVVDAIRAIDQDAEADILTEFARRGVLLTRTELVCDRGIRSPVD